MTTKDRIIEYLEYVGSGQNAFEKKIGIANGYIAHSKGSFGSKTIAKISASCSDLNIAWLLTGDGEMLKTTTQEKIAPSEQAGDISIPKEVWEVIRNQSASLKAKDDQMDKVIAMLEEQLNKKGEGVGNAGAAVG